MPYVGNQPTSVAFLTDTFNGNGSTTAFTLSAAPATSSSILVAVSGVLQDPSTYSTTGTTLNFSAAPPSGTGNISVRFLGIPASGVTTTAYRTQTEFTATAGQTTFSVPSYTVGYIDVYRNGVLLGSADFTATNGTTVVLTAGASAGDLIETVSFYVSSVVNAIPAQNNAVIDSYLLSMSASKLTGSQSIPKTVLPTGSVLQVVTVGYATNATTTSTTYSDTGLSASITPTSASSKILVLVSQGVNAVGGAAVGYGYQTAVGVQLLRGSTVLLTPASDSGGKYSAAFGTGAAPASGNIVIWAIVSMNYLDSPATTSSVTYKTQFAKGTSGMGTMYANDGAGGSYITLMEIAA